MPKHQLPVLTEIAILTALALVLDKLTLFTMPQGGSVTLVMLPLLLLGARRGLSASLLAGTLTGLLQLFFGGYFLNAFQVGLDYILAYGALGLAGLIQLQAGRKQAVGLAAAGTLAGASRLFFHFLSGIIFYADYTPEGYSVWYYSLTYNASYMIPNTLISLAIILILYKSRPQLFFP